MANNYKTLVAELSKSYPLKSPDDDDSKFPAIGTPLDDGVDSTLRESLAKSVKINHYYVEDLLTDCINRISNCMLLREKANDIEARAIGEALNYQIQTKTLNTSKAVAKLLEPIKATMGQFSKGIKQNNAGGADFYGDETIWANVKKLEDSLLTEQLNEYKIIKAKALDKGNGSNYVERFSFIKELFDLSIVEAYRRALVCSKSLKEIYGINIEFPKIKAVGYLNELAIWAQKASDALDVELDQRYLGEIAFVTGMDDILKDNELITKTQFNTQLPSGKITFTLLSSHFEKSLMKDVLLRSLRLQIRTKDDSKIKIWPARISLPGNSTLGPSFETFACIAPNIHKDPTDSETFVRGVHNINPIGEWTLTLPARSVTGDNTQPDIIDNIILLLRVSYRRL